MTDPQTVTEIYKWVIEDVITKLMPEFENSGIPDSVITMIHQIWNAKMRDTMAVQQSQVQAQLHGLQLDQTVASVLYKKSHLGNFNWYDPGNMAHLPGHSQSTGSVISKASSTMVRPGTLLQPPNPVTKKQDSAQSLPIREDLLQYTVNTVPTQQELLPTGFAQNEKSNSSFQTAPAAHPLDKEITTPIERTPAVAKDSNNVNSSTGVADPSKVQKNKLEDSEDSDEEEYDDRRVDTSSWENLAFCLFEKCRKVKTKRKFLLSGGVMYLNGRDYLFRAAEGEFQLQL
ncbi:uncharacterized protein LOC126327208 [Schistocerca gregaria]|uniref:uncharacterized protein LOC126327208 n=1 Tax=Schistocerca gregaria TaxID=7010 RepID=UPI00211E2517|nr:uncharacterized protein LOC126327208 [Schistocerca gregaria]